MYCDAFDAEIAADRDFYKDTNFRVDMVKEMANAEHVPWFKQLIIVCKGSEVANQIPGREKYAQLTLQTRNQPYKLSQLKHSIVVNPQRLLTQKMRQAGKTLADVRYYITRNKADYEAIQA